MIVHSCKFDRDIYLDPIEDRWYRIPHEFNIEIKTDAGVYRVHVDSNFHFDARSGPMIVDWYVPHIGDQKLLKSWLMHDIGSYDICFTFHENNDIFRINLLQAGTEWLKRNLILMSVSVSDFYFGKPIKGEREYINSDKIHVRMDAG